MTHPHILLTGQINAGKSTLIRRLLEQWKGTVSGFLTVTGEASESGERPVYILPAGGTGSFDYVNLVGTGGSAARGRPEVFDTLGKAYLDAPGELVVMDELGIMEERAEAFQAAVLRRLDGRTPVLGVVKAKSHPFTDLVRAHPGVRLYTVTEENRDALYAGLLPLIRSWGRERRRQ